MYFLTNRSLLLTNFGFYNSRRTSSSELDLDLDNRTLDSIMTQDCFEEFLSSTFTDLDSNLLSSEARCKKFIQFYGELPPDKKGPFLYMLADNYGFDTKKTQTLAAECGKEDSETAVLGRADKLRGSLQPRHRALFSLIVRLEGGLQFLVNLRADVLTLTRQKTNTEVQTALYQELNVCLRELLTLWFTPGFLDVSRVTWDSPCALMQQICKFEAVHPVTSWQDIKRRVGPNRRCFVFTHKSMAGVSVVVLHVGLTPDISDCLHDLIDKKSFCEKEDKTINETDNKPTYETNEKEDSSKINAAVFYSITSTQKGLQGIEMGKHLIRAAVGKLLEEFPGMTQFSSLSPVPGFRDWLLATIKQKISSGTDPVSPLLRVEDVSALAPFKKASQATPLETFADLVTSHEWCHTEKLQEVMKPILLHLCAHYLYKEKRRNFALNPVANFHLGNGAELWRINFLADTSKQALDQACSLMVNYRYYLDAKDTNVLNYQQRQEIAVSKQVLDILG